jgi:hypothetical protein
VKGRVPVQSWPACRWRQLRVCKAQALKRQQEVDPRVVQTGGCHPSGPGTEEDTGHDRSRGSCYMRHLVQVH